MTDLLWVGPNQMIPVGPIQVITLKGPDATQRMASSCNNRGSLGRATLRTYRP